MSSSGWKTGFQAGAAPLAAPPNRLACSLIGGTLLTMDEKTLHTLEFPLILDRLAGYCAFSASAEMARALRPTADLEEARHRQEEAAEAVRLLASRPETTIGGARDVRELVQAASRDAVLTPSDLLEIKGTLVASRTMARIFERLDEQFPRLTEIASRLPQPHGLVDSISRSISDRGEVLDSASDALARVRSELRVAHDRLLSRMERMVSDSQISPYLQEALVTQRDGRYVLPLRAEFKGRVKAIVHDQSSSGATLFVEPLAVVDLNNRYRELQLEERDEIRRVLTALTREVAARGPEIEAAVATLAEMDLAFARAKYAEALEATTPELVPWRPREGNRHPGSTVRLWSARHPLLDPATVVPVDVELDAQTYALVITGPNTGGKTVTLKTVGLLAIMAQAGLPIPVKHGSQLSVFEAVFADIGDEQSIEQSLSTFSGHITNIIRILGRANPRSLVILDELGAGTDPQEGAALARAILTRLLEAGITTLVATHYPELKAYAHTTRGVVNASVEFDLETLSPTYHLTLGLPGRSNALAIADRLGLPLEIIEAARAGLDPADLRAEDLLDEIHRQRDLARAAREEAAGLRQEAETLRSELAGRLESIEDERRGILEAAREEAREEVEAVRDDLRALRRELARARQPLEVVERVEAEVADLEAEVEVPDERQAPEIPETAPRRAVRLGDRVRLRTLDRPGVVTSLSEQEAEVQVGNLRVRARRGELELLGEREAPPEPVDDQPESPTTTLEADTASPGVELDLRGYRVDEALLALDRYLDSAFLAGLPYVRVIHGKGTGRLREAVRQELNDHPQIASFEAGRVGEGGEGVTVARLVSG